MNKESLPIIIGSAQCKQPKETPEPLDPLSLIEKATELAIKDVGAPEIKKEIDAVFMVNINSWSYEDAPAELSTKIGINPVQKVYLPDGGDTPQMLVNRAARMIRSGQRKVVLITGGEAKYSLNKAKKGKIKLNWPQQKEPEYIEGELYNGTSEFENRYGLPIPSYSYAFFETALRAESNHNLEEHQLYTGKIFEKYSKVAAENPHAWDQRAYTAEEIATPSSENRKVLHPYTKRMCANMFVDLSASIIITSQTVAEELEINQSKWIYHLGGADFKNIFELTRRPKLTTSPAARAGVKIALERAGLELDEIDAFDIYSCFPSIVQIITREIGLMGDDPRDITTTGGLAYFGGPWSNYSLHGIVSAVKQIQQNPKLKIMVIANGGYNSKQSFGIYSGMTNKKSQQNLDATEIQEKILKRALPEPQKEANGVITIEAYTIPY
ncbi:MAG: hypothetical protein GF383_11210, partial [Candidatus Lokiarchaeota archaeon]|nr:hypothetical protein [Candidatus Lokiarchaeota archaeon]MBD3341276.1 hypothetical protein [Candidatus Lokiarchaeota archaeon]